MTHGGKREGAGAKPVKGKEHKIKFTKEEQEKLRMNYQEERTIPKMVKKAVDDAIDYKNEVMDIAEVSMELFNSEEGKVCFYIPSKVKGGWNNLMTVDLGIECSNIRYYKRLGLFQIIVSMERYITEGTDEGNWVQNTKDQVSKLEEMFNRSEIENYIIYNKNYPSWIKEVSKPECTELRKINTDFYWKYMEKARKIENGYLDMKIYISQINYDYQMSNWLEKNYDSLFRDKVRERVSKDQQDRYIKYSEILEVIKEHIATKNTQVIMPEFFYSDDKRKGLENKKDDVTESLKMLEQKAEELEKIESSEIDIEYEKAFMKDEMENLKGKIEEYTLEIEEEKKWLVESRKKNEKIKLQGEEGVLIKFEWDNFLAKEEISFIERNNGELEEDSDVFIILNRIVKKIAKDKEEYEKLKFECPQEILEEYKTLYSKYLEKLFYIQGKTGVDIPKITDERISNIESEIIDNIPVEHDRILEKPKSIYSQYPNVEVSSVIEFREMNIQLRKYWFEKIEPLVAEFREKGNDYNTDLNYCKRLIDVLKERIVEYHKTMIKIQGKDWPKQYQELADYYRTREEEDIYNDKQKENSQKVKRYREKLRVIDEGIIDTYTTFKNEIEDRLREKLSEIKKEIDRFDELRDEMITFEIKPNNYIVSN